MLKIVSIFSLIAICACEFTIPGRLRNAQRLNGGGLFETSEIGISPAITNGERAVLGQFPYHAAIFMTTSSGLTFICGGALLRNNFVITVSKKIMVIRWITVTCLNFFILV
jgi:hypothetical protein